MQQTAGAYLRTVLAAQGKGSTESERTVLKSMRAALLMQVRWIEGNLKRVEDPLMKEYLQMQRRSLLELVREIEHELGIKPKKAKVKKGELS